MASKTAIANTALRRIGVSQRITDIETDTTTEATTINAVYDEARDNVLREWDWPFAQRYEKLAQLVEEPNPDWQFSYRVPSDYIKARRIIEPSQADLNTLNLPGLKLAPLNNQGQPSVPFSIGNDVADTTGGLVIFTDHPDPCLHYTARFTNEGLFSDTFASALSYRIAMEVGGALSANPNIFDSMESKYFAAVELAKTRASNEEEPKPDPRARSVSARD